MIRYAALIPVKEHSERVPGKNFRRLGGVPLWQYIVGTLCGMDEIGGIYIDTDSARFTADVLRGFPKVHAIARPPELCGDFVATNRLFEHDLTQIGGEYDRFIQTHTTNPMLKAARIREAMQRFEQALASGAADSLFSVNAHFSRFYRRDGAAVNHNPEELLRTQDLDPLLEENSSIYLFTRESFAWRRRRIGRRPMMFEMSPQESIDIDDEEKWRLVELALESASR
jgi:CMP-N-acetylneuraminic acid synthetase